MDKRIVEGLKEFMVGKIKLSSFLVNISLVVIIGLVVLFQMGEIIKVVMKVLLLVMFMIFLVIHVIQGFKVMVEDYVPNKLIAQTIMVSVVVLNIQFFVYLKELIGLV